LGLLLLPGCGSTELASHWRDADVAIDGINTEWNENTVYVEDPGVVVGVSNDDDFVYLCMMTSNREVQRQVILSGLIVWLDAENDKNKDFGIRFPLGMREAGVPPPDTSSDRTGKPDVPDLKKLFEEHVSSNDEFEIIGPAGMGVRRVHASEAQGVEVKAGFSRGALVYELKVPLGRRDADRHYAVDSRPGATIGVGLESPESDRGNVRDRMGGGPGGIPPRGGPGGVGDGTFGGRGGGMRGPRGGGQPERPEPFGVWAGVHLAAGS
jgi:hypothetical protein